MENGDFVKVKGEGGRRGRPRKWIVTNTASLELGRVEVTAYDASGDTMVVPVGDVSPYPVKREREVEVTLHRDNTLRGPDDV